MVLITGTPLNGEVGLRRSFCKETRATGCDRLFLRGRLHMQHSPSQGIARGETDEPTKLSICLALLSATLVANLALSKTHPIHLGSIVFCRVLARATRSSCFFTKTAMAISTSTARAQGCGSMSVATEAWMPTWHEYPLRPQQ